MIQKFTAKKEWIIHNFELTYNGDQREWYLDVYDKVAKRKQK